ncbi:putative acetyltransferase [Moritella sp. JT01]|uniref:GNAT family N-acetyltransferase n=1 Tax=Moritella sp. JT01 TaxID=756698 RepID=UPI000791BED5|nr:GNAT family N-acetyltransferase [Moritella sp. JT01]KXO08025.1 putative acetyltransferase [Moritella sp. JT01]
MEQLLLETKRLILRPYKYSDANQVKNLAGDSRVSDPTLNIPHPYTIDMAREWISTHKNKWQERTGLIYAVIEKDTDQLFGTMSLVEINETDAELGYWFGHPYWGNGYCSEAAEALIAYSFSVMGITSLYAEHLASNPASGRVMIKNGMHYSGSKHKKNRDGILSKVETYEIKHT